MSGGNVYVRDDEFGWLGAKINSTDGGKADVTVYVPTDSEGKKKPKEVKRSIKLSEYSGESLPLQNIDADGNLIEKEDMRDLPSLHEAAILYNLKTRHEKLNPYTRVGDMVIAMNPFQWLTHLYSEEQRTLFADKIIFKAPEAGDPRKGLPPHIYETSAMAYRGLAAHGLHQSILVSGESGSGKTETVKIIMKHLAAVQSLSADSAIFSADATDAIVKRILESNALLEAFGNAKTVRNNNSSRFGKYIQLQFDVEDGRSAELAGKKLPTCVLAGSINNTYLLEKSRVVGHESAERTYHIFYQILAAPEDVKTKLWGGLAGATNSSFKYIGDCEPLLIDDMTDGQKWEETANALAGIGIEGEKFDTFMRAICTVMQLGNISFAENPSNSEETIIDSKDELNKLGDLLAVETSDIEKALTTRAVTIGRETYDKPLKLSESQETRDAFAKEIYFQIFDYIVAVMNTMTSAENNYDKANEVQEFGRVSLLDIFGFESFEVNRFEQLCINYANEKLQQLYTLDTFRSVQEEYEDEDIELESVTFPDNASVLRLVEGRVGVIALLNEECVRPNGNDETFVSKVCLVNKDNPDMLQGRLFRPYEFAINHYAGTVKYDARMFVHKNTDNISSNLLDLACKSSNELISVELKAAADARLAKPSGGRKKKGQSTTVATKFRSQLTALMNSISETRTRYVRCIKPNPEKLPVRLNLLSTAEQLRCAGVLSAIAISRAAFPTRLHHEDFIERFDFLSSARFGDDEDEKKVEAGEGNSSSRAYVEKVVLDILGDDTTVKEEGQELTAYACGKTRVYFRSGVLEQFEAKRAAALSTHVITMQRYARGYLERSHFQKVKASVIAIQATMRRYNRRKLFLRILQAAINISCWVRCIYAKKLLIRLRKYKAATIIQKYWRSALFFGYFTKCRAAAITIQKTTRGFLTRKHNMEKTEQNMRQSKTFNKLKDFKQSILKLGRAAALADAIAEKAEENKLEGIEEQDSLSDEVEVEVALLTNANEQLMRELEALKAENVKIKEKYHNTEFQLKAVSIVKNKLEDTLKVKEKDISYLRSEVAKAKQKKKHDFSVMKQAQDVKEDEYKSKISDLEAKLQAAKETIKANRRVRVQPAGLNGSFRRASLRNQKGKKKFSDNFDYDTEQDVLTNLGKKLQPIMDPIGSIMVNSNGKKKQKKKWKWAK
mmetsp:Transcript_17371/g.24755  ORF Transcript_17371/g.24755 Transcript_17371/m.24755 type:complete len:1182 (-) Transcript_17371:445-3990(-)